MSSPSLATLSWPVPTSCKTPLKTVSWSYRPGVSSTPTPSQTDVPAAEFSTTAVPPPESVFTSLSKPFMSSIAPLSTIMSDEGLRAYSAPAASVPATTSVEPAIGIIPGEDQGVRPEHREAQGPVGGIHDRAGV